MPTPPEYQNHGVNIIQTYGEKRFRIGQTVYAHSILLTPEYVGAWEVDEAAAMTIENLSALLHHTPQLEVVLIGTGKTIMPIPQRVRQVFRSKHIAVDVMDTGAACRTYHVLLAEKRRVGVALMVL